jgi:hypothetical protein
VRVAAGVRKSPPAAIMIGIGTNPGQLFAAGWSACFRKCDWACNRITGHSGNSFVSDGNSLLIIPAVQMHTCRSRTPDGVSAKGVLAGRSDGSEAGNGTAATPMPMGRTCADDAIRLFWRFNVAQSTVTSRTIAVEPFSELASTSACRVSSAKSPRPWWTKHTRFVRTQKPRAATSTLRSTWSEQDPPRSNPESRRSSLCESRSDRRL